MAGRWKMEMSREVPKMTDTCDRLRKHYFIVVDAAGKEPRVVGIGDGENGFPTREDAEAKQEMLKFGAEGIRTGIIEVEEKAYEA